MACKLSKARQEAHNRAIQKRIARELAKMQSLKDKKRRIKNWAIWRRKFYKWAWKNHQEEFGKLCVVETIAVANGYIRNIILHDTMPDISGRERNSNRYIKVIENNVYSHIEYIRLDDYDLKAIINHQNGYLWVDIKDALPQMFNGRHQPTVLYEEFCRLCQQRKRLAIQQKEHEKYLKLLQERCALSANNCLRVFKLKKISNKNNESAKNIFSIFSLKKAIQ